MKEPTAQAGEERGYGSIATSIVSQAESREPRQVRGGSHIRVTSLNAGHPWPWTPVAALPRVRRSPSLHGRLPKCGSVAQPDSGGLGVITNPAVTTHPGSGLRQGTPPTPPPTPPPAQRSVRPAAPTPSSVSPCASRIVLVSCASGCRYIPRSPGPAGPAACVRAGRGGGGQSLPTSSWLAGPGPTSKGRRRRRRSGGGAGG